MGGEKSALSALCVRQSEMAGVQGRESIVVSVVWFSRGFVCEAGRKEVKYLVTQYSSVAFSKQ